MNKVRLSKAACDALDLEFRNWSNFEIILRTVNKKWVLSRHAALNTIDTDTLINALVLGWEPVVD